MTMVKIQKGAKQIIPISNGTATKAVITLFMWVVMYSFLFLLGVNGLYSGGPETSFPFLVVEKGLKVSLLAEIWPERRRNKKFCIG